ncbi:MAG: hypothetical protein IT348_09375 [Candidatus Eisenbacteria bacterium]|nr:hypothetical protein [Candidatus Eisenbacteria bacterium]
MIEFRFARHKQFTIMAATLLMALLFGALAWNSAGKLRVYAGAFTVLFGVIAPAMHLPRLFQRGVVLRIDAQGIEDSRIGAGLVRWEEIAHMAVRNALVVKALEVYPHEPWKVVHRMPLVARLFASINVMGGKPAMLVQFQDVEPGFDEALAVIETLSAASGGLTR